MFFWDDNGIRILYRQHIPYTGIDQYFIYNITTNEKYKIWEKGDLDWDNLEDVDFAWSPDGNKVAFWTWVCIKLDDSYSYCVTKMSRLHIIDIGLKKEVCCKYGIESSNGAIAFSPDNTKISYVLGSGIYIAEIH